MQAWGKENLYRIVTTLLASLPPQSKRRPSDRALAVAYLVKHKWLDNFNKTLYIYMGKIYIFIRTEKGKNQIQNK